MPRRGASRPPESRPARAFDRVAPQRPQGAASVRVTPDDPARWLEQALGGRPVPPALVVVGLADGSLLDLLEARAPKTRVLALEPDRAAMLTFRARRDWSVWQPRLLYLAGPDYAGSDQAWRFLDRDADRCQVLVHPRLAHTPDALAALHVVKRIVFGARANAEARRKFAPTYLANVLRNAGAIATGHDVRALSGRFAGVAAVIAAAGPSLDAVVGELPALRARALTIAVDTALRPLLHAGVQPHLVVGADPSLANARHFHALPDCPETWLVAESALQRRATSRFDGRTFWFRLSNHHPWPWLRQAGIDVGQIEMWGSVLTAAFQVACLAGCDPIVIAGADLAFTDARPYCRGTTYEFDWAAATARGTSLHDTWQAQIARHQAVETRDLHGRPTRTTTSMQAFRDWLRTAAARSGRRVINATGAGILEGPGIEVLALRESIPGTSPGMPPAPFASEPAMSPYPRDIVRHLADLRAACAVHPPASPLDDWHTFTDARLDRTAVAEAIEQLTLVSAGQAAAIPVVSDIDPIVSATLPSRLPDALARLRAALTGAPLPAARDHALPADAGATLLEALDGLAGLAARTAAAPDTGAATEVAHDPRTPVSASAVLPDDERPAVEAFEGRLGLAWMDDTIRRRHGFFSRPVSSRASARDQRDDEPRPPTVVPPRLLVALMAEWLQCVASRDTSVAMAVAIDRLLGIATNHGAAGDQLPARRIVVRLTAHAAHRDVTIEVALRMAHRSLARSLTGHLHPEHDATSGPCITTRIPVEHAGSVHAISLTFVLQDHPETPAAAAQFLTPRVLTDAGLPRSSMAYAVPDGVVCPALFGDTSTLVAEDGRTHPYLTWPRPMLGELPAPGGGHVAWGIGPPDAPTGRIAYVMQRSDPDAPVTIDTLPFRPSVGCWHDDRLYWTCYPSGLGSWAPGAPAARACPELTLRAVESTANGLRLVPCVRDETGAMVRADIDHVWTWNGSARARILAESPGVVSSRSAAGRWTATAHPDSDVVRLTDPDGAALRLTCHHPFRLAWAGTSLLVCTNDGEVLLFERLADTLDALSPAPGGCASTALETR